MVYLRTAIVVLVVSFLAVCLATVSAIQHPSISSLQYADNDRVEFSDWMAMHHKSYSSRKEMEDRFAVYKSNKQYIATIQDDGTARYGMTEYADLTPEEFALKRRACLNYDADMLAHPAPIAMDEWKLSNDTPASIDWRAKGAVTAVKNQADCGSCWAFSTIANIESQWFLAGHTLTSLSEEQLLECDALDCSCLGGWPLSAYQYIIEAGGVMSDQAYSYCVPPLGDCFACNPNHNKTMCGPGPDWCNATCKFAAANAVAKISSFVRLGEDEDAIAAYLAEHGPLSVAFNAGIALQFYRSGVYDPLFCDPTVLDHAVLLVGYGTDGTKPFWIVKNSWGPTWGEEGYFRIARGKGKCGINTYVTSAKV